MKIAIYSQEFSEKHLPFLESLISKVIVNNYYLTIASSFHSYLKEQISLPEKVECFSEVESLSDIDFVFSIGGDGTLLKTIPLIVENDIPVMGINTGRLGFLSTISPDEIDMALTSIKNAQYYFESRTLLELSMMDSPFSQFDLALNEITIQKTDSSSMITIRAYLDGKYLNTYWADGLIISTPTGSTAYSLSCNGPIVLPDSGNIILTPIAPHNLNVRPFVIPDNIEVTLKVESRSENYLVAMDSKSISIPCAAEIKIKKSDSGMRLLRLNEHDYLNTLRNKLMWGADKRN